MRVRMNPRVAERLDPTHDSDRLIPSLYDRNLSERRGPGGSKLEDAGFAGSGFSSSGPGITAPIASRLKGPGTGPSHDRQGSHRVCAPPQPSTRDRRAP